MKGISDIPEKLNSVIKQTNTSKTSGLDAELFKKTFDQVLSDSSKQIGQPPTSSPISGLGEINSIMMPITDTSEDSMAKDTDQLLNLLSRYTKDLNDPGKSLKDIEPLLKEIKTGADALSAAAKTGSASPALKSVAEKSSLLANVEYMKFMRGDYV